MFGFGSRNEDPPVHGKGAAVELSFADQIGDGFARQTTSDEASEGRDDLGVEPCLRKAEQPTFGEPGQVAEEQVSLTGRSMRGSTESLGGLLKDFADGQEFPTSRAICCAWKCEARGSMTASMPPARTASSWWTVRPIRWSVTRL